MAQHFDPGTNQWISGTATYVYKPAPHPPTTFPVFDPSINAWISSGDYATNPAPVKPYFSFLSNSWVTS